MLASACRGKDFGPWHFCRKVLHLCTGFHILWNSLQSFRGRIWKSSCQGIEIRLHLCMSTPETEKEWYLDEEIFSELKNILHLDVTPQSKNLTKCTYEEGSDIFEKKFHWTDTVWKNMLKNARWMEEKKYLLSVLCKGGKQNLSSSLKCFEQCLNDDKRRQPSKWDSG